MTMKYSLTPPAWPEVPEKLVEFLEAMYPPRCKVPGEYLETHMRYAGMVSLVQQLRRQCVGSNKGGSGFGMAGLLTPEEEDLLIEDQAEAEATRQSLPTGKQ